MTIHVHVLREGRALCGHRGVPSSWSKDHCWIEEYRFRADHPVFKTMKGEPLVRCSGCV